MKRNNPFEVAFMIIIAAFLVVLDVLLIIYFIYCCVTIHHNIEEIILWAIIMFSTFGIFNFFCVEMIKDILNNN